MKVCVGDRTFDDNIIGASRDALRACIDDELNELAARVGLRVENVVVPEVVLSPEVQKALDAIVQSRLETEKAAQDELRAKAQAAAEQAKQEGQIRVEQSRLQEEAKQKTLLATLEEERLAAQKAVIEAERRNEQAKVEAEKAIIEAQKANDLLSAAASTGNQCRSSRSRGREGESRIGHQNAAGPALHSQSWVSEPANSSSQRRGPGQDR